MFVCALTAQVAELKDKVYNLEVTMQGATDEADKQADAMSLLQNQLNDRIAELEQARTESASALQSELDAVKARYGPYLS